MIIHTGYTSSLTECSTCVDKNHVPIISCRVGKSE